MKKVCEFIAIVAIDGNFTVKMLVNKLLKTNRETVWQILTASMGKRKVCPRFIPHQLNEAWEVCYVQHCKDIIIKLVKNNTNFHDSYHNMGLEI